MQESSMKQAESRTSVYCLLLTGFLIGVVFDPKDGSSYIPPKHWLTFTGVYSDMSQKTELFIATNYDNLIQPT
jgi:hypothetical protein